MVTGEEPPEDLLEQVDMYVQLEGMFDSGRQWITSKVQPGLWWALFPDHPLSKVATIVAQLPASTASVERVWSQFAWSIEGRERLHLKSVYHEVYIRCNRHLTPNGMPRSQLQ